MAKAFDFATPPFDRLRPAEMERVEAAVDIVFLRQGRRVLERGQLPDHLYVVVKGLVEERAAGDEVVTVHDPGDAFDSGILVHQACRHDFVVREEAICYRLPIEDFLELTANNPEFAGFFFRDISHKLDALARRGSDAGPGAVGALTARVSGVGLHAPTYVPPETDLHEAAVRMDAEGTRALLLDDGAGRLGIVTGVDLTRAAVRDRRPLSTPVREVARYELVGVDEDGFLFEAALLMARRKVRYLVVRRAGAVVGVLDAANVLSSLANQSDPIGALIDRAGSLPELVEASERITHMIRQLHGTGTKVGYITQISTELHRRVTERVFGLLAPEGLPERACLVVMGSEGRGEYMLKTDQDNGLVLDDGADSDPEAVRAFARELVDALVAAGFPPCPGGIMADNPKWSTTVSGYRQAVRSWVAEPGEQALMDVAIFYDAAPVAGRADLAASAKRALLDELDGNAAFHARFARAIDMFDGGGQGGGGLLAGLFGRGEEPRLDVKKAGIFPLMHGVRALSLERGLEETNTVERIRRLTDLGLFDRAQGQELADAFTYLLGLRLSARLERLRLHQTPDNLVNTAELGKLERDLLKDSLQIVRRFKEVVRHHFRLGMF